MGKVGSRTLKTKCPYSIPLPTGYTITEGAKSLVGNSGMTSFSANGGAGSTDDGHTAIRNTPFSVKFLGSTYSAIYVGTNSYITFGGGSTLYSSLSLGPVAVPALAGIHVGSADCSSVTTYDRSGTNFYRMRFEGFASTNLSGSPIIYEITFFKQQQVSDDIFIEIVVGSHGFLNGTWGITNGGNPATRRSFFNLSRCEGNIGSSSILSQNKSYVVILSSTGQYKNIYSGYYVSSVVT